MTPRFLSSLVAAAAALGIAASLVAVPATAAKPAPQVQPAAPYVAESYSVSGKVPGARRQVALEKKRGSSWRVVARKRSAANGKVVFRGLKGAGVYRLKASGFTSRTVKVTPGQRTRIASAPGNGVADLPSVSANGRFVAFMSEATGLVPGDTNGEPDVFVRDLKTGKVTRESVGSGGTQGNGRSYAPAITADGRFLVFNTDATNLVAGSDNGFSHVVYRDRVTGTNTLVSRDVLGGDANGDSYGATISADGSKVAFTSVAGDLVFNDSNGSSDIFVWTPSTDALGLASRNGNNRGDGASFLPVLSGNGRYLLFSSLSDNLSMFDSQDQRQVYRHDLESGIARMVSVIDGTQDGGASLSNPGGVSDDGRWVVFESTASLHPDDERPGYDLYLADMTAEELTVVSAGGNSSTDKGSISRDGKWLSFASNSTHWVGGDTNDSSDVFRMRRSSGAVTVVSVTPKGKVGNGASDAPALSPNGRFVAFASDAGNLVKGETPAFRDVFRRDLR